GVRTVLGLTGAAVLAWFGARTLWTAFRVRLGGEATEEVQAPRNAFWTALIACASNPLTIISWAAIFAAASTASVAGDAGSTTALLVGVGCGSFTWMAILSVAVNAARRKVGERGLQIADGVAGAGLLGFAGVLGLRTLSE
ncbi:MAG TPA: LysE family transporter, partial [Solirubrobacteraceae bacterium]|nr:LysE family transporter [Solirubrobacteraceae bacterium]